MIMTREDEKDFLKANKCHSCNEFFSKTNYIVRDHDHRTGTYRGAAHQKCNICYVASYLPVFVIV